MECDYLHQVSQMDRRETLVQGPDNKMYKYKLKSRWGRKPNYLLHIAIISQQKIVLSSYKYLFLSLVWQHYIDQGINNITYRKYVSISHKILDNV